MHFTKAVSILSPGQVRCCTFVGGSTGQYISDTLLAFSPGDSSHITVKTQGTTRTCTTLVSIKDQTSTEIVDPSHPVTRDELQEMKQRIHAALFPSQFDTRPENHLNTDTTTNDDKTHNDTKINADSDTDKKDGTADDRAKALRSTSTIKGIALMGTCPPGVDVDFYANVVREKPAGCFVLLDGYKQVRSTLETGKVNLLKLNQSELQKLVDGYTTPTLSINPTSTSLPSSSTTTLAALEIAARLCFEKFGLDYLAITDGPCQAYLFEHASETFDHNDERGNNDSTSNHNKASSTDRKDGLTIEDGINTYANKADDHCRKNADKSRERKRIVVYSYSLPDLGDRLANPIGAGDTVAAITLLSFLAPPLEHKYTHACTLRAGGTHKRSRTSLSFSSSSFAPIPAPAVFSMKDAFKVGLAAGTASCLTMTGMVCTRVRYGVDCVELWVGSACGESTLIFALSGLRLMLT